MDDEKPIKVELLYGWVAVKSEPMVFQPMPPRTLMDKIEYEARELWDWVILPAILFSIAFTSFLYAIKFAFA